MLNSKIVDFGTYCPQCKNWKTPDSEEPCRECLNIGGRYDGSHKPINFNPKKKGMKTKK